MKRKIMTWKAADQAVTRLGFLLIENASRRLRDTGSDLAGSYPTADPGFVSNGFVSDDPSQSWWTYDSETVQTIGDGIDIPYPDAHADAKVPSNICWYSFQNLIRIRMKEAREEIYQNLLSQNREPRTSKQASRNEFGRR